MIDIKMVHPSIIMYFMLYNMTKQLTILDKCK